MTSPACLACGKTDCRPLGEMKDVGGSLKLKETGTLYECPECGLLFRSPYLTEEEVIAQYQALTAEKWTAERGTRPDFDALLGYLTPRMTQGKILDVGCFRGDLLADLPPTWKKLGIEPSDDAAEIAQKRGIEIVGKSLLEATQLDLSLDVITAVDLIEHLLRPMELMQFAQKSMRPGGLLLVATGCADHWFWKRHRLDYWYNWSDHVAFFRRRWFDWAAKRSDMEVVEEVRFCHYIFTPKQRAYQAAQCFAYDLTDAVHRLPVVGSPLTKLPPFSKVRGWGFSPRAWWAQDHFLVALRRK